MAQKDSEAGSSDGCARRRTPMYLTPMTRLDLLVVKLSCCMIWRRRAAAGQLFFKGPSYGVNIDDLEIRKIYVKYTVFLPVRKKAMTLTHHLKNRMQTRDNLQLTKVLVNRKV